MGGTRKKNILIQPDAGLGNRLYCLYSAFYYSMITDSGFDMIWLRENCCNVPLGKIIDLKSLPKGMRIHRTYHLGYKNIYCLPTVCSNIFMKLVKLRYRYYTSEDTRDIFNSKEELGFTEIFIDKKKSCIKANGRFFDTKHFWNVRNAIRPSAAIRKRVEEIMGDYCNKETLDMILLTGRSAQAASENSGIYEYDDESDGISESPGDVFNGEYNFVGDSDFPDARCQHGVITASSKKSRPNGSISKNGSLARIENKRVIGIHIRRTDNKTSIENSPTDSFKLLMRQLEAENSNTWFYLATDDENLEIELKYKFKVIPHATFADTKARDNVKSIMDAYVDMLCLACCDKIYGSCGSSFSEMAALIGNTELELVK